MRTEYEQKPKPASQKKIREDQFERILVQVTQQDIAAGEDKASRLKAEGWEIDPDRSSGFEGYHYLRKPRVDVEAERAQRLERYLSWTKAPMAEGQRPDPKGSAIRETVETDQDPLDPKTTAALQSLASAANS